MQGGRFILASFDSGTVSGTYKYTFPPGCPEVTWQVSGTLTRVNPPDPYTYGYTTISLNGTSPNRFSCGTYYYVPFVENVTLQNNGCDYATGTWQDSEGKHGDEILTKSPDIPNSETTIETAWSPQWPTIGQFRQKLSGGVSFDGRQVTELPGFDSSDTCYYEGGPVRYHLTGGWWIVGFYATPPYYFYTDAWIDDYIGQSPDSVATYRANGRAPCDYHYQQLMSIYTGGHSGSKYNYAVGNIGGGLDATTVYSFRNNTYISRIYP